MSTHLFEERQSFTALGVVSVIMLAFAVFIYVTGTKSRQEVFAIGMVVFASVLLMAGFRYFKTEVSTTDLRFGFPLLKRRMLLSGLEVGDIVPIPFWYGLGVHYIRGMWVWNARLGRGVIIRSGRKTYLLGSNQPERLQSALQERIHLTARS